MVAGVALVAAVVVVLEGVEDLGERGLDVRRGQVGASVGDGDGRRVARSLASRWPLKLLQSDTPSSRNLALAEIVRTDDHPMAGRALELLFEEHSRFEIIMAGRREDAYVSSNFVLVLFVN